MFSSRVWVLGLAVSLAGAASSQAAWPGGGAPALAPLLQPVQYYEERERFVFNGQEYCWYEDGWNGPGWYLCGLAYDDGAGWGGGEGWNGFYAPLYARNWRHHRHGYGENEPNRNWRHHREGGFQPHFRGGENQGGLQPHFRGGQNQGGFQPHFRGGENQVGGGQPHHNWGNQGGGFQHRSFGGAERGGFQQHGAGGFQQHGAGGFQQHGAGGFHQGGGGGVQQGGGAVRPRGYSGGGGGGGGGGQHGPRQGF